MHLQGMLSSAMPSHTLKPSIPTVPSLGEETGDNLTLWGDDAGVF